jgi:putative salt-induced outer membrane protein YdiY
MRILQVFLFTAALLTAIAAHADQITLKNGDRLTGTIVEFDGKELRMKTELAGEVKVKWEDIADLTGTEPLTVELKDGQRLLGPFATRADRLVVKTEEAGEVEADLAAVAGIRSKERQEAYDLEIERLRNPRIVDLWAGFVDLGFSQTRGNAEVSTFTTAAEANRETSRDRIGVRFRSIFARSDLGELSGTTANAIRGGLGYNLNLSPRSYVFGSTDLEFDEFQALDLRFVPAGGFGWKVWRRGKSSFDLQGGASLNKEFFSTGLRRTSGEALIGEELVYELNDRFHFMEKFIVYPNLTDRGEVRMIFDSSVAAKLSRWLSWQITLGDRFISNPAPGRQRNDILLTTGIRLIFEK